MLCGVGGNPTNEECCGGYRTGYRNFPILHPIKPPPACCAPVPCSSCCSNPCIPFCCPQYCEQNCPPARRERIMMRCPPKPCCLTPCPSFKCCPAPCCSPTIRTNANTSYLVPIPKPPMPSVIVRPKNTCPNVF